MVDLHAHSDRRHHGDRGCGRQRLSRQFDQGSHRLRQAQSGQGDLQHLRSGRRAAYGGRDVRGPVRRAPGPHSVQGLGAGNQRSSRRRSESGIQRHFGKRAPGASGQAENSRGCRIGALCRPARCAGPGGAAARLRTAARLVCIFRTRRHGPARGRGGHVRPTGRRRGCGSDRRWRGATAAHPRRGGGSARPPPAPSAAR